MITFVGGREIYTMNNDGTEIRCLTDALKEHGLLLNLDLSPDGKSLGFTVQEDSHSPFTRVCTITLDSKEARYLTPRRQIHSFGQWLPNDSIMYLEKTIRPAESDKYLCAMDNDGSQQRRIFHCYSYRGVRYSSDMDNYHVGAISPDGTKIILTSERDNQLYMLREGPPPVLIENEGLKTQNVVWAPDGSKFAFTTIRSQASRYYPLYIINADGMNRQRVGRVVAESDFTWSPDNQEIAIIGFRKGEFAINIINTQTAKSRTVTTIEHDPQSGDMPSCPEWSPDGRYILYTTYESPHIHLYRADIATKQTELLVGDEGGFRHISDLLWS